MQLSSLIPFRRSRRRLTLGLALGCATALAGAAAPAPERTPAQLTELLARFDQAKPGADRDALALEIDRVAAQRYAVVSRLFWYTDLDAAETAARATHRPILALRMLGRLDEDLSCTNSRMFRTTLYADAGVSSFLREHFILYWSSERAVPRVTIDFGDGRKLERTTTGNSAHYVLDADGRVLDVLPGLYAPLAFRKELEQSLALAAKVRGKSPRDRDALVAAYHDRLVRATQAAGAALGEVAYIRGAHRPMRPGEAEAAVATAQRATMSKAYVEVPDLQKIGMTTAASLRDDAALWSAIAQRIYPALGTAKQPVLDARSRALIEHLHGAEPTLRATPAEVAAMIDRLEQHVLADTALNQTQLRPQIAAQLAQHGAMDFTELNTFIYATVFHTPASDPWLGLVPHTEFTGLPGDGVVLPR